MLKKTFCSSPWFHLRILPDGTYNTCRWASNKISKENLKDKSLQDFYNGFEMSALRTQLLNGEIPEICSSCQYEEKFNKINGRKKQLLKSGITTDDFDLKLRASPHYELFKYSLENNGISSYQPNDLQIDLGNTCNSSCIMCSPKYSTRLEHDYKLLNLESSDLFANFNISKDWTRDLTLVDKFVNELVKLPNIKYIHFLGGETLYMKSFYQICDKLIESGLSKNLIIGTTTNGTLYNEKIEYYVKNFRQFHLGISIECISKLNDYIRYPSNISDVLEIIKKYNLLRNANKNLFISLRITPNIFTIYEFDDLARYIIKNNLTVESCDILTNPSVLRMELMPSDIREEIILKLKNIIDEYCFNKNEDIINIRNIEFINQTISNSIVEYYDFMKTFKEPNNIEEERYKLVKFLKAFEHLRNNRITDYAPRYKEFLTSYGY
jgi:MoaA/NifB/PqqE/SkfB family radical SAM enzyme